MHVYRYRSPGLLSQKELIYDEWYFASREELNDPIDMQSRFEFPGNSTEIWKRVLRALWKDSEYIDFFANYLSNISPISYEKILSEYEHHVKNLISHAYESNNFNLFKLEQLNSHINQLSSLLSLYAPNAGYSVSLSKSNSDMLMWSHYASSHTGYCLIYRPINKKLNQCPHRTKDSLIVSDGHTSLIGCDFPLEEIQYNNQLEPINAFYLLPSFNTGLQFKSDSERLHFHSKIKQQLLTKNECWDYEEEVRLLLLQPNHWISGQSEYSSYQRLFHYDFDQVAGIVFGARMKKNEKAALKEIINKKLEERIRLENCKGGRKYIFDFLYQQAEICNSSRTVKIIDNELISMGSVINVGTPFYERQLKRWKDFKGMTWDSEMFNYDDIP
ncbi:DUF2971 domain-containing protein [Aeromonas sp. Y311-2]|uniref:DUF2971 domain-containing protein n=1 Tax=Aeromonas TaxID=642 RepID=UPI0022E43EAA|nr:DUF2971 domain-containing protein [Aeromonas sp. Y311-2]